MILCTVFRHYNTLRQGSLDGFYFKIGSTWNFFWKNPAEKELSHMDRCQVLDLALGSKSKVETQIID